MRIKIFSHNDLDGYSCTLLAQIAVGKDNVSADQCGYYNINEKITEFIEQGVHKFYDKIFITDISITDELAERINNSEELSAKFCLLDHHPTVTHLNKYNWCTVQVEDDVEKVCGTSLFYIKLITENLINATTTLDYFVEKVKRFDTWLWKEKYDDIVAKDFNDIFRIYGADRFLEMFYTRLTTHVGDPSEIITDMDKFLLKLENEKIQDYINKKNKFIFKKTLEFEGRKYRVGIVVADEYLSELGNELCERNPEIDFIAMISGLNTVSYRTVKEDIDLGHLVENWYGGGGHPKAAGSQINFNLKKQILDMII